MPRNKNPHNAKSLSINGDVSNPIRTFQTLFHCSRLAVETLDCGPQVRLISIEEKSKAGACEGVAENLPYLSNGAH
jgi:hypothetical protein